MISYSPIMKAAQWDSKSWKSVLTSYFKLSKQSTILFSKAIFAAFPRFSILSAVWCVRSEECWWTVELYQLCVFLQEMFNVHIEKKQQSSQMFKSRRQARQVLLFDSQLVFCKEIILSDNLLQPNLSVSDSEANLAYLEII